MNFSEYMAIFSGNTDLLEKAKLEKRIASYNNAVYMNFVNALEKIPGIVTQYEERTAKLKADVPVLEDIVAKQWGKEVELKQLKSDLAAIDRKITFQLAPKHDEKDGVEIKQDNKNKSMVAEPAIAYPVSIKEEQDALRKQREYPRL